MSCRNSALNVANRVLEEHTKSMGVEGGKYEQMRSLLATMRALCHEECIDFESLIWSSGSEYDNMTSQAKD